MHWSHFWLHFSIINYFDNFRRSRVKINLLFKHKMLFSNMFISFLIKIFEIPYETFGNACNGNGSGNVTLTPR